MPTSREQLVQALMQQPDKFADFRRSDNVDDRRQNNILAEYMRSVLPSGEMISSAVSDPFRPIIPSNDSLAIEPTPLGIEAGLNDIRISGPVQFGKLAPSYNRYQKK